MKDGDKGFRVSYDHGDCDLTVEQGLIKGLKSISDSLDAGERPEDRFTMRTVDLDLQALDYTALDVQRTRAKLGASQSVFAALLGVSTKTVQSWEQGVSPSAMARRLLDMINEDPMRFLEILRDSLKHKPDDADADHAQHA